MIRDREVVELLGRLVAIDSVNPSLVPGAAGEREIAGFVADWAAGAGLRADVLEETPGRPSVVVRSGGAGDGGVGDGGTGDGGTLLLCGHLDTVGTAGMADPLTPRIDGDRMYGRGAYDMKAGLAAALVACREAATAGVAGEVVVAAVADEEHSSTGVQDVLRHLTADAVTADAAVVTEPTELAVATAHKGFVWTEIRVTGRAAHGSRPHLGVDAILKTGPVLVALEGLDERLRGRRHPTLGTGSLHASLITGGVEASTIPDRCVLTIERRTLPGETTADVEEEVAELLSGCRAADPALDATSRTTLSRPPFETDRGTPVVGAVTEAAASVLGRPPAVTGVSYWADSALIAAAGIPTVLFGPGGDGAHAATEWVSLSETVACARTLAATAARFRR